jgi:hypothetical protein
MASAMFFLESTVAYSAYRGRRRKRGGRRGRGGGRTSRCAWRWLTDSIWFGDTVWHYKCGLDCRWWTGDTRLPRFAEKCCRQDSTRPSRFWSKAIVSNCTREADSDPRIHGERAWLRCCWTCRSKRSCTRSGTKRYQGTAISATLAYSDHCPLDREKEMWKCLSTRRN